ncbi:MAG TPA: response regulator [Oligoflexus sp.]|uniref:response regulator n=1 Tax=Oligoflexus sp. TaxID=1971216 RepID=UPI002D7E6364|nr:response regulator [Oligoflexus sp.]HET9237818.1 response regulator [Oligoflexus sp.]
MGQEYTKRPIEELQAEAKNGNLESQSALAMLNELGLIPQASPAEAAKLYAQSAKAGDPVAALYLGVIYENGAPGVPVDKKAAESYYDMAEKGGFHKAEDRLADAGVGRRTVLIVDDSPSVRSVTRSLLSKSGFDVVEAADAAQAIRFLQNGGRADLVISDVEMPNMDGLEMLAIIRGRLQRKDLPVVMLTSVREVGVLKKAKTLGVQGWVLKPYDHDMLVQIVKKALVA